MHAHLFCSINQASGCEGLFHSNCGDFIENIHSSLVKSSLFEQSKQFKHITMAKSTLSNDLSDVFLCVHDTNLNIILYKIEWQRKACIHYSAVQMAM